MATAENSVTTSTSLLPEYQESYLKDLLASARGIADKSILYGTPLTDEQGRALYQTAGGGYTADVTQARLDQRGQPMAAVEGGVPEADIMGFAPSQERAIQMLTGTYNPRTGQYEGGGIGLYAPMMESARQALEQGIGMYQIGAEAAGESTAAYDPRSYEAYMDPYISDVIQATTRDINRQSDIARQGIADAAIQAGAFGGSREAVQRGALARDTMQQIANTTAQLRSEGYGQAQQAAMSAFENQMNRGQSASQLFGQLGQGIAGAGVQQGALGEAAQAASARDINALFNMGSLQQAQQQSEYDVQRANAMEQAMEPYQRAAWMSDIYQGVPSVSSTLTSTQYAQPNPVASILGTAQALNSSGILRST